jgi:hypothetical protein
VKARRQTQAAKTVARSKRAAQVALLCLLKAGLLTEKA